MNPWSLFCFLNVVALGVVYACYMMFLRREHSFMLNRGYLLSGVLVSFLIPWAGVSGLLPDVHGLLFPVSAHQGVFWQVLLPVSTVGLAAPLQTGWTWTDSFKLFYFLVTGLMLLRFLLRLARLWLLKRRARPGVYAGSRVFFVPGSGPSFSFFGCIFLSEQLEQEPGGEVIVMHELAHIRGWHTLDVLLLESLKVFFWMNPFLFLADRLLRETHEFQADAVVLQNGTDTDQYRKLLLFQMGGTPLLLSHSFNYSLTKRRLNMCAQRCTQRGWWKPVTAIVLSTAAVFMCVSVANARILTGTAQTSGQSQSVDYPSSVAQIVLDQPSSASPASGAGVVLTADVMPQFPGGTSKLFEFLQKNLRYPQVARDNNIQGTVVISFVVETDGSIGDIRVSRSLSPDCDAEAVRVVSVMPRWTPGEQDGKLVRVQYVLPVKFALSQNAPASARALSDSASRSKKIGIPVAAGPSPEDGVMMMVEEMASFPGGPRKMYEYLNQNLKYPEADRDRRIQGTVALTFVVETDGSIKNIQVARSLSPGCDAEAVRVASMMPKWTPGKHKGEVVRVQYVLPVKFTITAQ